jgi:hypothetical protein
MSTTLSKKQRAKLARQREDERNKKANHTGDCEHIACCLRGMLFLIQFDGHVSTASTLATRTLERLVHFAENGDHLAVRKGLELLYPQLWKVPFRDHPDSYYSSMSRVMEIESRLKKM